MSQKTEPSLRDLVAAPVPLSVGGITITVQPMGWYTSVDAIEAIIPSLETMPPIPDGGSGELSAADMGEWLTWLKVNRDDVVEFCHLASGQEKAAIAAIAPTSLLELVFGILDVNSDFFVASLPGLAQRVGDRVVSLVQKIAKAFQDSTTISSASSNTVTSTAS